MSKDSDSVSDSFKRATQEMLKWESKMFPIKAVTVASLVLLAAWLLAIAYFVLRLIGG